MWMKRRSGRSSKALVKIDRGGKGSRVVIGRTEDGRYLRVIYVPDPEPDSAFVITAYDLKGKPLAAYRSRRKRKGRR
jgi:hypothetical protein